MPLTFNELYLMVYDSCEDATECLKEIEMCLTSIVQSWSCDRKYF